MKKWNYTLHQGKELRNLIYGNDTEENDIKIIMLLKECYQELIAQPIFDDYDKNNLKEAFNFLDGDDEIIKLYFAHNKDFYNYGFTNAEELINDRLHEFYDLCDSLNVWVAI